MGEMVTPAQWAKKHNVSGAWARMLIGEGRLETAKKDGGRWHLDEDDMPQQVNMRGSQPVEDLTGRQFGELTVLESINNRCCCKCSCGKKNIMVLRSALLSGGVKSCGHLARIRPLRGPLKDITGNRYGRLVVKHATTLRAYGFAPVWLARCDCGKALLVNSMNLKQGQIKSCGCLWSRGGQSYGKCPSCDKRFPITLNGEPTPQFCPTCTELRAGRNWFVCPICDKLFPAPPSRDKITCSKECEREWRRILHTGVGVRWGPEARERLRQLGQTENLKLGTEAAKRSPIAGSFETNRNAKVWTLIDPAGQEHIVRNLHLWAKQNVALFFEEPDEKSANRIRAGFQAIARTLEGKRTGNQRGALTYKGWSLKAPPEKPIDDESRAAELEAGGDRR